MQSHVCLAVRGVRRSWFQMLIWMLVIPILLASTANGPIIQHAAAQETDNTVHVVARGETLSEIAQSYGVAMETVMRLNGIANADAIYVGQRLRIPTTPDDLDTESDTELGLNTDPEATDATASDPADSSDGNTDTATTAPLEQDTEAVQTVVGAENSVDITSLQPIRTTSLNPTYIVRTGDTVPGIALRYDLSVTALRTINQLPPGDLIRAGQELILPATRDELRFSPAPLRYTVQAGDSLGLIAQRNNTTLAALMTLNRISNPDLIQPGQELAIPANSGSEPAPQVGPAQSGFYYHTVRAGETPSELAQQFNSTPQALVRYNGLPDIATLYAGLEVRIPYGPPILNRRTPPTPRSGTEFLISISRQRCWVMQGNQVRYEWKCSTGQGEWVTRTGTFPIQSKFEMAKSSAYRLDMPYWLGLYDVGAFENGIHGIPVDWASGEKLWDSLVGQPATFGCAMLL